MDKKLFLIIFLLSLIFNSKCKENISEEEEEEDWEEGDDYDDFEGNAYFKQSLKEYLVANKLFGSDRLIKPDEMKKIFLDVISDGDPEGAGYMERVFHDLTEYFVNTYYKDRPEIRGKDIYDLIDINAISMKFEQMMGDNPYYNGYEEEKDFDSRDVVGEPSSDV